MRCACPPDGEIFFSTRCSESLEAKQIHSLFGDQQGEDSSWGDLVSRTGSPPPLLRTYRSVQPSLLRIMATLLPSGDGAGLMFEPPKRAYVVRAPEVRS